MIWGGITMTGKPDLHVCQGRVTGVFYRDNVLAPYVIPLAQRHGPGFISRMIMLGHIGQELLQTTFNDGIFVLYRGLR